MREIKETRQKLIDIIANHQASEPSVKLPVGVLSARARITRQSFNRYYSDLKDYASGLKPIGDLITDSSSTRTRELMNLHQASLKDVQQKMSTLEAEHDREMKKTLDSYITSLMINDVTLHGANEIRVTLEKQTLHNLELTKQLNHLELELTRAKIAATTPGTAAPRSSNGEKVKVDVDLAKAVTIYGSTASEDAFDDKKDAAIEAAVRSINKIAVEKSCHIVLFAERYNSRFSLFFENYECPSDGLYVIVRLPIFSRTELKIFLGKLSPCQSISMHVPHMESKAHMNAQRSFYFGGVPKYELDAADAADSVGLALGFDKVIQYRVKQGD